MKFVSQIWDFWLDSWPCQTSKNKWWDGTKEGAFSSLVNFGEAIHLPFGKIISLDAFNTFDNDNTSIPAILTDFIVDTVSYKGRVAIKYGYNWPTTFLRSINGINIRCTLGFGAVGSVPENIRIAVMELTAYLYEHRGDETRVIPPNILSNISQYKEWKI
jgi:uncharacterized phiE125 gp8 family phage protein